MRSRQATNFSLSVQSSGTTSGVLSAMLLGTRTAPFSVLGIDLLVAPLPIHLPLVFTGDRATQALPISANLPKGYTLAAQTVHLAAVVGVLERHGRHGVTAAQRDQRVWSEHVDQPAVDLAPLGGRRVGVRDLLAAGCLQ